MQDGNQGTDDKSMSGLGLGLGLDGNQGTDDKSMSGLGLEAQADYIPPVRRDRDAKGCFLPGHTVGGKPAKYQTAQELEDAIEKYFQKCDAENQPYTVVDLACGIGFSHRMSLINYMKREKDGTTPYYDIIKRAKAKIEGQRVRGMLTGENHVIGSIFILKNDHNYVDKQEIAQSVDVSGLEKYSDDEREALKGLARRMIEKREEETE